MTIPDNWGRDWNELPGSRETPPDAVQAVVDCIQAYGWRVFQAILTATEIETRGRLLAALVSGLPQGLQGEFRGVAEDAAA